MARIRGPFLARDDRFSTLFSPDAEIERLATGFRFTEGPVWFAEERSLYFSDLLEDTIYRLPPSHEVEVFRRPSHASNGLTRDPQGRLVACEHATRRVTRTEPDGSLTVLAEEFDGGRLNSPNDVVVRSNGAVYFTDPPYGIRPGEQEQPVQGVYRVDPETGQVALVADDLLGPNGLAFSPDEDRLYVSDTEESRCHVRVFEVRPDGSLAGGEVFHSLRVRARGVPDGMKVDREGNLYCAGPGGLWIFGPSGEHLGTVAPPEWPANCAWGGEDWKSLYLTAGSSVYRVRGNVSGVPVPPPQEPGGTESG